MASDAPAAAETDTQASNVANESGITPESLSKTLKEKLEAKHVDIEDMSGTSSPSPPPTPLSSSLTWRFPGGCGQAFQAMIVSPLFEKKNSLARHRLVNSVLKTEIAAIHAWTPKCFTSEEWEKRQRQ